MGSLEASWTYAERYVPEDAVLQSGRQRATEVGCVPIQAGGGAALRFLAAVVGARHVVEIGTGTGVSGTWLLRGMTPDGVLTSIDIEAEHQRLARLTLDEAGFTGSRVRLINGPALEVLPRLTSAAYDLVFVDALKREYVDYLGEALRILRPGGLVAFDNALWRGKVADPMVRDEDTLALRRLGGMLRDEETLVPILLPVGDGLLVALKR
jgi:predicted O-methyltransferase YrrM